MPNQKIINVDFSQKTKTTERAVQKQNSENIDILNNVIRVNFITRKVLDSKPSSLKKDKTDYTPAPKTFHKSTILYVESPIEKVIKRETSEFETTSIQTFCDTFRHLYIIASTKTNPQDLTIEELEEEGFKTLEKENWETAQVYFLELKQRQSKLGYYFYTFAELLKQPINFDQPYSKKNNHRIKELLQITATLICEGANTEKDRENLKKILETIPIILSFFINERNMILCYVINELYKKIETSTEKAFKKMAKKLQKEIDLYLQSF